jgi:hypothetical protein
MLEEIKEDENLSQEVIDEIVASFNETLRLLESNRSSS